jgi:lipoprotein-anchoring transpeptidase ErfK/SrfK
MNFARFSLFALAALTASALPLRAANPSPILLVSVPDQRLVLVSNGARVAEYPVSTSRFGIGDRPRSFSTPLGELEIAAKIGNGACEGQVFHACHPTREVIRPNAPGRDPIVTRILRLRGLEKQNALAYNRGIYIHGTPQERLLGRPASYGCIRMRSRDVIRLFDEVPVRAKVDIVNLPVSQALHEMVGGRG